MDKKDNHTSTGSGMSDEQRKLALEEVLQCLMSLNMGYSPQIGGGDLAYEIGLLIKLQNSLGDVAEHKC